MIEVGAVTRQGLTIEIRLIHEDIEFKARMMQHEANGLVMALLLVLAQQDSFKWERIYNEAREANR